jgi:hypothetical protein
VTGAASEPTAAERSAAAIVTGFVAAMLLSYLEDRAIGAIHPFAIPVGAVAIAAACWRLLPRSVERGGVAGLIGSTFLALALLLFLAWPALLPIGGGSDLTHHLQLIGFIEQSWRLPRDPSSMESIGNMVNYTPGSHLLAAMAGRWLRSDGLHAMYPVLAVSTALKAGLVYLIARRAAPADEVRTPMALTAVVLLALPYDYSLGSFVRWSFYAQVISETCAVAMWWALVLWDLRPSRGVALLFGLAGAGAYLSWPVWIGPPVVALGVLMLLHGRIEFPRRIAHAALALAPIGLVAVLHAAGRMSSMAIVQSGGASFDLSPSRFGWTLLCLTAAGVVIGARRREARATVIVLGAIVLQTAALFVVARVSAADSPYMARKMAHLAVLPMAVLSALAIAHVCRVAARVIATQRLAWMTLLIAVAGAGGVIAAMPRHPPVITEDLYRAGLWARDHARPGCVDYLVPSDDSSYWLHHAVLRNPMHAPPGVAPPSFVYRDVVTRWVVGSGLPYAIADLTVVPREVRDEIDHAARFGSIVAGGRRNAGPCASEPHAVGSSINAPSNK